MGRTAPAAPRRKYTRLSSPVSLVFQRRNSATRQLGPRTPRSVSTFAQSRRARQACCLFVTRVNVEGGDRLDQLFVRCGTTSRCSLFKGPYCEYTRKRKRKRAFEKKAIIPWNISDFRHVLFFLSRVDYRRISSASARCSPEYPRDRYPTVAAFRGATAKRCPAEMPIIPCGFSLSLLFPTDSKVREDVTQRRRLHRKIWEIFSDGYAHG